MKQSRMKEKYRKRLLRKKLLKCLNDSRNKVKNE